MSTSSEKVLFEALQLPNDERTELVGSLLESLEPIDAGVEKAWIDEIERRVAQLDAGEVKTIPWSQVRADLFRKLSSVD